MIFLNNASYGSWEREMVEDYINHFPDSTEQLEASCQRWIADNFRTEHVLMTASGSQALELAALLIPWEEGAEVIFSTYSFPSTINPFVVGKFVPVLAEIGDDGCLSLEMVRKAVTDRTKAVVVTNYAGWNTEIRQLCEYCHSKNIYVIEDNAQGALSKTNGQMLGTYGDIGVLSFEKTKPITCGEGGAVLINNPFFWENAQILSRNGTSRLLHKKDHSVPYTWTQAGINCALSGSNLAILYGQFMHAWKDISARREKILQYKHELEGCGLSMPSISICPEGWNCSMFYVLTPNKEISGALKSFLQKNGIQALAHYGSLRETPMGCAMRYEGNGEAHDFDETMIRLPLYTELSKEEIKYICRMVHNFFDTY